MSLTSMGTAFRVSVLPPASQLFMLSYLPNSRSGFYEMVAAAVADLISWGRGRATLLFSLLAPVVVTLLPAFS